MKTLFLALLAVWPALAVAAEPPSLAFPEQKIGLPPLSLAQSGRQLPPAGLWHPDALTRFSFRAAAKPPKRVSNMPIVVPRENADAKMVKAPDTSTDYKLIVKTPDVESQGERTSRP
jgi:hypothetical protein